MAENFKSLHKIAYSKEYTGSYETRYVAEIRHVGLGTYRVIKDRYELLLKNKIDAQFFKWDEQWSRNVHRDRSLADREANQNLADEKTREVQSKLKAIENILNSSLEIDVTIEWKSLIDKTKFKTSNPQLELPKELIKVQNPIQPTHESLPEKPNKTNFQPQFSFFDKLIKSKAQQKINQADMLFENAIKTWEKKVKAVETKNRKLDATYNKQIEDALKQKDVIKQKYDLLEKDWENQKDIYINNQHIRNGKIDHFKKNYFLKDSDAVLEYCELVLNNSEYPDEFPKDFTFEYNPENKLLIIDYVLPAPEVFPRLSEVKYIAVRKELKEYFISETQLAKIFDNAIYNICLRTLHEIFESDKADAIEIAVFNGWVETINKATGKRSNNCIVSAQAKKSEFLEIELSNVDPKACFKNLKGVGSSKLIGITAIQPLIQVNRNDKRFVSSYDVAKTLDEGYNLAIMHWEDFEHLIRELFEKEFSSNGGEVKVTQASRDGGVDAVAFDPDPIRGGKIVIQAKRYTNTVGVSSVRDLYGTVMNEGATKGILVSTADYGPDAYEFAKNKPLTLLNGSNLLFLLEKHGHKARIDLAEAKRLQANTV